ncbi:MAG: hypothetical protein Q9159_002954 [Coniocarpon cinnabarinum]
MAYAASRLSSYSNNSNLSRATPLPSAQVSTQTLLNALHSSYSQSKPLNLESSTSLVVNTWLAAAREGPDGRLGGTVDSEIASRAWEHARRRAEDACIVLGSLHESTPSLFAPFVSALPISTPNIFYTALAAVRPFLTCATPSNPSTSRHSALAATFTLNLSGNLIGASLKLSTSGIDTSRGLLNVPAERGFRAFDVFYYLLSAASSAKEREFLGLRSPQDYTLLQRSGTFDPPPYLPTADDAAAAEEFRDNLKAIGITGRARRDLVSVLAALLKLGDTLGYLVDDDQLAGVCEDAAGLLGLEPEVLLQKCSSEERQILIAGIYESLVDWIISKANHAITVDFRGGKRKSHSSGSSSPDAFTPTSSEEENEETACITVLECPNPDLGKAVALRTVFDDTEGINAEMKQDGVSLSPAGHSVIKEMQDAVSAHEPELGIMAGYLGQQQELHRDRKEAVLEKVSHEVELGAFLKGLLLHAAGHQTVGHANRFDLMTVIGSSRVWFHLCLHPTDESPASIAATSAPWSAGAPSRQLRAWRLPEWANRRNKQLDYTADFDLDEFCTRYSRLGCKEGYDGIESFTLERGWSNGEVHIGTERVWIREGPWWELESMLDMVPPDHSPGNVMGGNFGANPETGSGFFTTPFGDNMTLQESRDNLLQHNQSTTTLEHHSQAPPARSIAPTQMTARNVSTGDYGLGTTGDAKATLDYTHGLDPELADPKHVEEQPISKTRRIWVKLVWALTFWIPSVLLRSIGRMRRPDVRLAWREKLVLVSLILLLNGAIMFIIVGLGNVLCPNFDKAFNAVELATHQGSTDFYVGIHGNVYDITKFVKVDHASGAGIQIQQSQIQQTAGQVCGVMFPLPMDVACPGLVTSDTFQMSINQTAVPENIQGYTGPPLQHRSGQLAAYPSMRDKHWYQNTFLPTMKDYYKGALVWSVNDMKKQGNQQGRQWVRIHDSVFDLSQYFYTKAAMQNYPAASFLDPAVEEFVQQNPGGDVTSQWESYSSSNSSGANLNWQCLNNAFYIGETDFREDVKCQFTNYLLLAFAVIICLVIGVKFLSALQLGSKKRPAQQDKFVICQVPAYTEGENELRKGLDSLTSLAYDNKRKLIMVVCDGMIVGGGNDRPTPKIVLDILGVDPKIDPPALPFKSCGVGSEKLNYGKVYSGLYEYEGNVVPYLVVVKVGKESEQTKSKPGNRGKRDSQIMVMNFLNRVHHRAPMSPLELEMFHQVNNIIGVDPELYEYLFMVDADTTVSPDSLNRLVAACAHDAKIAGICGETSLENEEKSWTTMIQVYEYYISHHLAKAFESLFGSVTCLPGCFCMYRLRTVDKGRPLIISDKVIDEYSIQAVDTLHKKNLLSLGEDRYLTTLMTKHFPAMSYKFVPSAYAKTAAPESWSVLLSQRRRWINSTVHNLAELVLLKDLCGFCCFSMRFVVFIDLFGTLMLPATCGYIAYIIYRIAAHVGPIPYISIAMIAAVYGLQAVIFIIKRQWQHVGWMIIYLLAFPIYSLVLPLYSFWKQDDFSWGNTRIVIGEKGNKAIVATEDEGFDPRAIPLQSWDDYALANNLPGRRGYNAQITSEKAYGAYADEVELDDMRSVYSSAKPASTIMTGFKSANPNTYLPSQSPAPYGRPTMQYRQSTMSGISYHDKPPSQGHSPYMAGRPQSGMNNFASSENLMHMGSPTHGAQSPVPMNRAGRKSPMGFQPGSRPGSSMNLPNFRDTQSGMVEPSDGTIVEAIQSCLQVVDLDTVTKKQVKALVEQRLGVTLGTEKKAFLDRAIDDVLANM